MTRQEMFNRAAQGILAQGCASFDTERSICMYRGPNNTKCAIGHLIPDELYNPAMEENSLGADGPAQKLIIKAAHISYDQFNFACSLQACHDTAQVDNTIGSWDFISAFKQRMAALAMRHKLSAAVLEPTT